MNHKLCKLYKLAYQLRSSGLEAKADQVDYQIITYAQYNLLDRSLIDNGMKAARDALLNKWSDLSTMNRLEYAASRKLSLDEKSKIKAKILNLIKNIPYKILPETEYYKLGHRGNAELVPQEGVIYCSLPTEAQAKRVDALEEYTNPAFFNQLLQHEITHAIYKLLIDQKIYKEDVIKNIVISPDATRSVPNSSKYTFEPTEINSRMNSVRAAYPALNKQAITGDSLANEIFKSANIPCVKEGKYYKASFPKQFFATNAHDVLNKAMIKNKSDAGMAAYDLPYLLDPYVKSENFFGEDGVIIVVYDLDRLANSMNQIAIQDTKSDSVIA